MHPKIFLKEGKERSALNFHPWIFSGAIQKQDDGLQDGDLVDIFSGRKEFLGTAHFNKGSITARIITFKQENIDTDFWKKKIQSAYNLRKQLRLVGADGTNVFRLIHGEGDGLPGLIIDVYDDVAVMQCHTVGMYNQRIIIAEVLKDVLGNKLKTIYDKSAETIHKQNRDEIKNEFLLGEKTSGVVRENNIQFEVDWINGQKTGFFIDQRENRKLLASYSKNKNVANSFSYSGGFSLYALKAGATLVHSVDSSKRALEGYNKNLELNFDERANEKKRQEFFCKDVFDFFKNSEERYDIIVLDPPAFAKHIDSVKQAAIGYRNLNEAAFKKINNGGIVFTFSCSQAVDKILFRKIVFSAAARSGRTVRILHQLTQPADHPINIYHPEGEYLKGLVLHINGPLTPKGGIDTAIV